MNEPHVLQVRKSDGSLAEGVDTAFDLREVYRARTRTREMVEGIRTRITLGMSEDEARKLALAVCAEYGVTKHWHKPYIRFGAGTALTFHEPLQADYHLRDGDPFYVDLGPVWAASSGLEYEGDYGDTFVFGENREATKCIETAQLLFKEGEGRWKQGATGEEIYAFLKTRTEELGYRLQEKVDGHRVGNFPHQKYTRERLAKLKTVPSTALWILEIQILDLAERFGAFFEDVLGA